MEKKERNAARRETDERKTKRRLEREEEVGGGWMGASTRSSGVGHGAYPRRVSSNENSVASNEFVSSVGGKSERARERVVGTKLGRIA